MKKYLKIFIIVFSLALIGGWMFWQLYKNGIVKDTIENAVRQRTDSLYFIHYDSSFIDELNGNASFYRVSLQSDSLQEQLLQFNSASSSTIYNIYVDEVTISGANISGLMNNTVIEAKSIRLKRPVVYVIRSEKKENKLLNNNDSLIIYEKLLGKFNSINADEIIVEQGNLFFTDKSGQPQTAFKDINIQLRNFGIDRTKNYQNIVSYFVKDIVAKVKAVEMRDDSNLATFTDVEYNAPSKFIRLKKFLQTDKKGQIVFDVNNTVITGIATDSFIMKQQLKADELVSDGGLLTFYRKQDNKKDTGTDEIQIDNNYFNEAQLNKLSIGNTSLHIYKSEKSNGNPFIIENVRFNAANIQKLHSGTSIKNLIANSNWKFSAAGFSFLTDDSRYKINVGPFDIKNSSSAISIKSLTVVPAPTVVAFPRSVRVQHELIKLEFKNIALGGIDTRLLITQGRLEALTASLQPVISIYRDRTGAPDLASKVGKYPQQLLQKVKFPFWVKNVVIKNGVVSYKEKGTESGKVGTVTFRNINGTVSNLSNIKDYINKNNLLVLDASASFMGLCQLQTVWKLSLNSVKGAFDVSGVAGPFNVTELNPVIEPLEMVSVESGKVNRLTFNMTGTDYKTKGSVTVLYENLKIDVLKKDSLELKKNALKSLLANALINDGNPKNGVTRSSEINFQRDTTKSFFTLVWKSIFSAVKKTTQKL